MHQNTDTQSFILCNLLVMRDMCIRGEPGCNTLLFGLLWCFLCLRRRSVDPTKHANEFCETTSMNKTRTITATLRAGRITVTGTSWGGTASCPLLPAMMLSTRKITTTASASFSPSVTVTTISCRLFPACLFSNRRSWAMMWSLFSPWSHEKYTFYQFGHFLWTSTYLTGNEKT